MQMRTENLRYENLLRLSGTENARARNYGVRIVSLGGTTEGALGTLNALSSSLGGIARGDTSLLQTLGMYGIGGISPRTSPEQLINKIRARVQRGDLSKNEINALLSQLPLDDAQKRAIMSSRADLFSGEMGNFSVDERNIDALYKNAEMTENLRTSIDDALGFMSKFDNKITSAINSISGLVGALGANSEVIKGLTDLLTSNFPKILELLGKLGGGWSSAATAGAGGIMGSLLASAKKTWNVTKNLGSKAWEATKGGGSKAWRFLRTLAKGGFIADIALTPTQLGDGTIDGFLRSASLEQRAKFFAENPNSINNPYTKPFFSKDLINHIPMIYKSLPQLFGNTNSSTVNNYYINYNSPQQETSIPFYLAARNQNRRMWEEDSIYNFSY